MKSASGRAPRRHPQVRLSRLPARRSGPRGRGPRCSERAARPRRTGCPPTRFACRSPPSAPTAAPARPTGPRRARVQGRRLGAQRREDALDGPGAVATPGVRPGTASMRTRITCHGHRPAHEVGRGARASTGRPRSRCAGCAGPWRGRSTSPSCQFTLAKSGPPSSGRGQRLTTARRSTASRDQALAGGHPDRDAGHRPAHGLHGERHELTVERLAPEVGARVDVDRLGAGRDRLPWPHSAIWVRVTGTRSCGAPAAVETDLEHRSGPRRSAVRRGMRGSSRRAPATTRPVSGDRGRRGDEVLVGADTAPTGTEPARAAPARSRGPRRRRAAPRCRGRTHTAARAARPRGPPRRPCRPTSRARS